MAFKRKVVALLAPVLFLSYVSTRENKFHYEKNGVIRAPAERIFPYISNLKMGSVWSPYERKDPNLKKTFTGIDGQVGSVMDFDGNYDVGTGKIEILKTVPNKLVELKLTMIKPFQAEHVITYTLTPEGNGTRFSWSMSGENIFLSKLLSIFMNCEKMVTDEMTSGIIHLKAIVEGQNK